MSFTADEITDLAYLAALRDDRAAFDAYVDALVSEAPPPGYCPRCTDIADMSEAEMFRTTVALLLPGPVELPPDFGEDDLEAGVRWVLDLAERRNSAP